MIGAISELQATARGGASGGEGDLRYRYGGSPLKMGGVPQNHRFIGFYRP